MSTATTSLHVVPESKPSVAPFITAAVGDVNRPRAPLMARPSLDHLPGETGFVAGLKNVIGYQSRGVEFMLAQRRRFGPVFRTQIGPLPAVAVADPELLVRIFRNEDSAFSTALAWRFVFDKVDPAHDTFDGLGTLDMELHKDARKFLQPAFSPAAMNGYLGMASPIIERAIDSWMARGRVVFRPAIRRLLATVSARIFLGIDDEREGEMLDKALADIWGVVMAVVRHPLLSPNLRRAVRAWAQLRELLEMRMSERRTSGGADLFSRVCAGSEALPWLGDDGLIGLFIGIMLGAFDTTANGMASMAYLLAKHPDWQERLRDEAFAVGGAPVSYEDTKHLEVTDRAWKETLRLFPVAGYAPRVALSDVDLGGWRIPAGALMLGMMAPVLRGASTWSDPERFDPDRFSESRAEDRRHKGLFTPFGAGAHACIGLQLANVEAKAFWHAMLSRCRFRLAQDYEAHHAYKPLGSVSGQVGLVVSRL